MDPNQNPQIPGTVNPPVTPTNTKPLFVTEEEAAPPPLANFPANPPSLTPPPPPVPINQPPVLSGIPTPPPNSLTTSAGNNSSLPPIMPTPPKKKGKGKLIAGIVAVLVIAIALPVGLILVGQNTELREKARTVDEEGNCLADEVVATAIDSNGCTRNIHQRADCSTYQGGPYACPEPAQPTQPSAQPTSAPSGDGDGDGDEQGGAQQCNGNPGSAITADVDGQTISSQGCSVIDAFAQQYGTQGGAWWAARHNLEVVCNPTGIGADTNACDGQSMLSQNSLSVLNDFYFQAKNDGNTSRACINWVAAHNQAVNYCGGPTPAGAGATAGGSGAGTGGGAPSCTGVRIYKYPYTSGQLSDGSQLKPGDTVKVCVVSTGGGTPMVNVNGREGVAQESGPQGEKCLVYDIPADATTLSANGWITY